MSIMGRRAFPAFRGSDAMEVMRPGTVEALEECVRAAVSERMPLAIDGGRTKEAIGHAVRAERRLDLRGLTGITAYLPSELVLTAAAGTPLEEIERAIAERGQQLAFEPPDLRRLLGVEGTPTLGGMVACGWAGPRRLTAGAVRDHTLGIVGVTGRGDAIKAGGTVVKNVTGYDLPKLLCGSWGTLMALSAVSLRVLPRPARTASLVLEGLDAGAAVKAMARALGGKVEVTGAAWLPSAGGATRTLLRVEADPDGVAIRMAALAAAFADLPSAPLDHDESVEVWREIRDVLPFTGDRAQAIWRVLVPASKAGQIVQSLPAGNAILDWGGGLIWARAPMTDDDHVRQLAAEAGGHAILVRGDASLRVRVPVFPPLAPALNALNGRVKQAFDPLGLFNPGRLGPVELAPT